MSKILLVEDDATLATAVRDWLVMDDHMVDLLDDGREAREHLKFYQYDVLVLDVELPGISGYEICRNFRADGGNTPVLMLTARKSIDDKVSGFDAGADDYLVKPFHPKELSIRVKALLRRQESAVVHPVSIGGITIEPEKARVMRDGKELRLLPREYSLLLFFMRHPNQVFSADALLDRVWDTDSDASRETVRVQITNLRKKIDVPERESLIKTVHGVGYKMELPQ